MTPFVTGNPELDFLEQNPLLRYITEFKELYETEENASKILWSTHMIEDPRSAIFRMPREEKIQEVRDNYFKDYDPEKWPKVTMAYFQKCMDKEAWMYAIQAEKMDEMMMDLRKLSILNDKDFNKYLKIMDKATKIWDSLAIIKSKMIEAETTTELRGKGKRSAREKRT